MSHTQTPFVEPLESRRHLSAGPLAMTPHALRVRARQQAELDATVVAASMAELDSAAAAIAPLPMPPLNPPDTDALAALTAPDWFDLLVGSGTSDTSTTSSASPAATTPGLTGDSPTPYGLG